MESRRFLVGILFLTCLIGGVYWLSYDPTPSDKPKQEKKETESGVKKHEVSEFNLVETIKPGEVWELSAPRSIRTGDTIELEKPTVSLKQDGDTTVQIKASEGIYWMSGRRLQLRGTVQVERTKKNWVLKTELLNWNQTKGTINTDRRVSVLTPTKQLRAMGLWADLSAQRVTFQSDINISSR